MIRNFFGHLKTVCKHKWYVFLYCCKAGIPFQGLLHDLSKFSSVEFFESVKYYQGTYSPIDACKKKNGWSAAWLHHKGRNKHHYQYWVDDLDHGGKALDMPLKYKKELICDFMGAGHAYMGKEFSYDAEFEWWENKKSTCNLLMHPETMQFIDKFLKSCKEQGDVAFKKLTKMKEV